MLANRPATISAVVAGVLLGAVTSASGDLLATATISSAPNGGDFDYTISLTDTGTTNIGTFWFAWTPPGQPIEYDFLPSAPLATSQPAGWTGLISPGFPGTSIEYYNVSGNDISPGQTATFQFTSADTPAQLQGLAFGLFPITESFIYSGAPLVGTAARVDPVFVPEPSSLILAALSAIGFFWVARRSR
jgi:PEP-CTERM motif